LAEGKQAKQNRIEQLGSEFKALDELEKSYILGFTRGLALAAKQEAGAKDESAELPKFGAAGRNGIRYGCGNLS
jgi:hypothetical protein